MKAKIEVKKFESSLLVIGIINVLFGWCYNKVGISNINHGLYLIIFSLLLVMFLDRIIYVNLFDENGVFHMFVSEIIENYKIDQNENTKDINVNIRMYIFDHLRMYTQSTLPSLHSNL